MTAPPGEPTADLAAVAAGVAAPDLPATVAELGPVHFIGIGGVGMSGIARIMLARGVEVSGSDAKESRTLVALRALGARVHVGHEAGNVDGARTVVVSTAIRPDNPELLRARQSGARLLPRAAALAALMAGRVGVAVAGTHGKSTTTSMLAVGAQAAALDPSFAIGGDLNESGSNAHHGTGELFIAEADESDGSFLMLSPQLAVVTNVEADHLDQHGSAAVVVELFERFVRGLPPDGVLVYSADDAGAVAVAAAAGCRRRSYGESDRADLRLVDMVVEATGTRYTAVLDGTELGEVALPVTGRHMAADSAAAILAGIELGIGFDRLVTGLAAFRGVHRRFELRGQAAGVRVYDDYAHHPTEIAAQLAAARVVAGDGRLVVAFQPHLYSRTQAFVAEFGQALALADEVVVMAVYGAREDPIPGVTGAAVAAAVPLPAERVRFEPSWSAVAPELVRRARPGDLVVTMGAGDVTMIGPEVLSLLAEGSP